MCGKCKFAICDKPISGMLEISFPTSWIFSSKGLRTVRRYRSATGRFGDGDLKCFIQKQGVFEIPENCLITAL